MKKIQAKTANFLFIGKEYTYLIHSYAFVLSINCMLYPILTINTPSVDHIMLVRAYEA